MACIGRLRRHPVGFGCGRRKGQRRHVPLHGVRTPDSDLEPVENLVARPGGLLLGHARQYGSGCRCSPAASSPGTIRCVGAWRSRTGSSKSRPGNKVQARGDWLRPRPDTLFGPDPHPAGPRRHYAVTKTDAFYERPDLIDAQQRDTGITVLPVPPSL